jgi:hypothetical protein
LAWKTAFQANGVYKPADASAGFIVLRVRLAQACSLAPGGFSGRSRCRKDVLFVRDECANHGPVRGLGDLWR